MPIASGQCDDVLFMREVPGATPQECATYCEEAIHNWTKSMLEGDPCYLRWSPYCWKDCLDAINAWAKALEYWKGRQ